MTQPTLMIEHFLSALGDLLIVGDGEQIYALDFADCEERLHRLLFRRFGPTQLVQTDVQHTYTYQLAAYLDGELSEPLRDIMDARIAAEPALRALLEELEVGKALGLDLFAALARESVPQRLTRLRRSVR